MDHLKIAAGAAGLCLAVGVSGGGVAAKTAAPPKNATIKAVEKVAIKPNRYLQIGLRWDKDSYQIKSGGTLTVVNNAADEGPHTLTVVREKDLPKTAAQAFRCNVCNQLAQAHGFAENSDAPPQFQYLENGVGQATAPSLDKPGDSGVTGAGTRGEKIAFTVTAKKGSELYLLCLPHPWMQARLVVG